MQINSTQGINAYTAVQPNQNTSQATPPAQPAEVDQSSQNQEAAVVEISSEASAQLAAEKTDVQPAPEQQIQAPEQNQSSDQSEQPTPVIDIVA